MYSKKGENKKKHYGS